MGHPLFVFIALTLYCASAVAQNDDVASLNDLGMSEFAAGRYAEAADVFTRAYALEPRPELLKNAAVAWYRAEKCPNAISAASSFLQSEPVDSGESAQMRGLLGACKVRLAHEAVAAGSLDLAERLLDEVAASDPNEALSGRIDAVRIQIAQRRASDNVKEPLPPVGFALDEFAIEPTRVHGPADTTVVEGPRDTPRSSGAAGPIMMAVGGTALAGTLVYHLVAATQMQPEFRRVAADGADRTRYDQLDKRLRFANLMIPVGYVVGGLAAGYGVFLWVNRTPEGDTVAGWRASF